MKKYLFYTVSLGGGGAERVLTIIANKFSREINVKVVIVSLLDVENEYSLSDSIKVIRMHGENLNYISKIRLLRKILKSEKPDVLIAFMYFIAMQALLASMMLRIRVIVSERNDPKQEIAGRPIVGFIRNFLYLFANRFVFQTYDALNYFPKYVRNKSVVIMNPIRENLPQPYSGVRRNEIVNFCRLSPQKNLFLLIDAFCEVHKIHSQYILSIFGNGELYSDLHLYIEKRGLSSCVFLNSSISDIHSRIRNSAMFVSSSNYEGISNSMIEAMALGLPTICTDCPCGGAAMMIENGINGFLVPVGNRELLVNAMLKIIENPSLSKSLSIEAIKIRKRLSIDVIINDWKKLGL
jgi:glycosyltransferase involved in cell wall biosynthesis